jgi:hypothetical protein
MYLGDREMDVSYMARDIKYSYVLPNEDNPI